jgi:hypothetical protein
MSTSGDGIQRFPRLKRFTSAKEAKRERKRLGLSRLQSFEMRVAAGYLPRGYNHLSKRQKKLAKYIARGISIEDACHLSKCTREVFFRWRRAHPLFRKYLEKVSLLYAQRVDDKLEGQLPRAAQIVEEAMNSGDPYFEYEASKDLLKGKGKYKSSVQSQQQISGGINLTGKHEIHTHGMDKELMMMFVNALVGKAQETKEIKTIDVKALPESTESTEQEEK